jgi:hypothetical protein
MVKDLLCAAVAASPALLKLLYEIIRDRKDRKAKVNEEKPP